MTSIAPLPPSRQRPLAWLREALLSWGVRSQVPAPGAPRKRGAGQTRELCGPWTASASGDLCPNLPKRASLLPPVKIGGLPSSTVPTLPKKGRPG
jgi:hypothetical protein